MQWFPPGLFSLHSLKIIFLLHKKVAFSLGLLSFQFFCLLNFFLPLCSGIFLNYNAEHLDTGFESVQPGQAVIHGPAPFMAVSFPALLLQPNILSASTESVSPRSVVSGSCSFASGSAEEGRQLCLGMETCPHHSSAWERGLGKLSGALWGGSTSRK